MAKISHLKIRKLKMAELLTFCEHSFCILAPLKISTPLFQNFLNTTLELRRYCDEQKAIKASFLFEADEKLCLASRAFRTMVLACTLHPREEMRAAAQSVSDLLPEIVNPKRLTHEEIYNRAQLVLNSLNTLSDDLIEKLYLTEYAVQFKEAILNFINAFEHRQKVTKEHVNRDGMTLMRKLINLANDLFNYLELIYKYDMPASGKNIIDDLNEYINTVNAKIE